ncbi:DUF302 domain-containing protein [Magnetospira sp. QH-2]|uniref:DUF302 domain-containing protein n=1 Tax=Magnetospira sp. (strain QH-2) TaxID=1288970 RepID=UPI0003E811EB|nr:DUF302 domain-containing protein [Magnetospira sp. QH-2]CCQ74421.1 conserved exported protein of unknown function [Magnetospira sp. QH-2]
MRITLVKPVPSYFRVLPLGILALAAILLAASPVHAEGDGLIVKQSHFGVGKTLDRLGMALQRNGITIFARINHAAGARSVGMELAPVSVLIFGTPKMGTPLMQSNPAIGLDLPLKALAWQAADGTTSLAYTDPAWLAKRYSIANRDPVFMKMTGALNKFTNMATQRGGLPMQ